MKENRILLEISEWLNGHFSEIYITIAIILSFIIFRKIIRKLIQRQAKKYSFHQSRIVYMNKITGGGSFLLFLILLGFVWEISLAGLSVYFASVFTVVGVALFANWSILSNLSASILLFFFFPFKIGSSIKIMDGDNSIDGIIMDITMFYILIKTSSGDEVSYPNNLAMQKPFVHNNEESSF